MDYNGPRQASDLSTFALNSMPNFVERVSAPEDYERIQAKADRFGLPLFLVFSGRLTNEFKWLSTEYRRRVLVAQVGTKKELKELYFKFGVIINGKAVLVVPPAEEGGDAVEGSQRAVSFDGKWVMHRLQPFFKEHALETEVKPKPKEETKKEEEPAAPEEEKQKVKTEL